MLLGCCWPLPAATITQIATATSHPDLFSRLFTDTTSICAVCSLSDAKNPLFGASNPREID
jgi:hypothetical protein